MNPYEVLEISPGAAPDEIKAAYHRMAKQWHPDRFTGEAKADAEKKFRILAEAFNMLKDTVRRSEEANPHPAPEPIPEVAPAPPIQLDNNVEGDRAKGQKTAGDWYLEAKGAYEGKAYGRALALVLYALRIDNDHSEYHALHGKILEATGGDARQKIRALEEAVKLNPKDVDSFILLAQAFQNLGMQARATRLWNTVHNLNPNHPIFSQAAKASGKKGSLGKEQIQGLGEQLSALVAEARIALDKFFKRG
jgi:tetratricopeptide (TPR) repeat protein